MDVNATKLLASFLMIILFRFYLHTQTQTSSRCYILAPKKSNFPNVVQLLARSQDISLSPLYSKHHRHIIFFQSSLHYINTHPSFLSVSQLSSSLTPLFPKIRRRITTAFPQPLPKYIKQRMGLAGTPLLKIQADFLPNPLPGCQT
jgi:hypothetical protein